jgi:hypothetical protein
MIKVQKKVDGTYDVAELFKNPDFGSHTRPPILHKERAGGAGGQVGGEQERDVSCGDRGDAFAVHRRPSRTSGRRPTPWQPLAARCDATFVSRLTLLSLSSDVIGPLTRLLPDRHHAWPGAQLALSLRASLDGDPWPDSIGVGAAPHE